AARPSITVTPPHPDLLPARGEKERVTRFSGAQISCHRRVDNRHHFSYICFRTSPFSDAAWEAVPGSRGRVRCPRADLQSAPGRHSGINRLALRPGRDENSLDWDRQGRVTPAQRMRKTCPAGSQEAKAWCLGPCGGRLLGTGTAVERR